MRIYGGTIVWVGNSRECMILAQVVLLIDGEMFKATEDYFPYCF
ncbi:hypothetical protein [Anaplasma phagocytophilum]|uniref:Uncharacterized protein n=2 Tax=Anaplasma phagocytophilum TaxID=948 RepID=A0A0F3NK05_ANAPH|nr:hypothetical protein [Anaplasma phagocytophilum]AGR79714.1 hypothetical protein YYU_05835 [Anaplasma phagocytophilum str. HZ2]AGR80974.1 hypothetical protein WSQ_05900 [Anaplasma phagocytophilum str. JM]AGR82230.1 hypothetical protein YYY_05910 [Anaplasma phagocytophilum str. Dog2]KJV60179.1 hypothetical protein APHWEB_0695 [Anaplasma phagocytophilum str. Webster]KJV68393.1 hypothetical protein EPHNCH_0026 [Anaplasma phagocytophilum str. NCH-1]KJV83270.1 hypothetical protein APHHGE2_0056 [